MRCFLWAMLFAGIRKFRQSGAFDPTNDESLTGPFQIYRLLASVSSAPDACGPTERRGIAFERHSLQRAARPDFAPHAVRQGAQLPGASARRGADQASSGRRHGASGRPSQSGPRRETDLRNEPRRDVRNVTRRPSITGSKRCAAAERRDSTTCWITNRASACVKVEERRGERSGPTRAGKRGPVARNEQAW